MSENLPPRILEHRTPDVLRADQDSNTIAPLHAGDWYTPLSSRAVFWRPHYIAESPVLQHLPLLFWLIDILRPTRVIQIGLGEGVAYLGLCQAVDKLDLGTACIGISTKGEKIPQALQENHDARYADFSRLISGGLQEMRPGSEVGIDLLILQKNLDAEETDILKDRVLPNLSEHAIVIVLHHAGHENPVASVLTKDRNPNLLFQGLYHGCDMEVVLHGMSQPDRLRHLATQFPGTPAYLAFRQVINRMGQGLHYEQQVRTGSLGQERIQAIETQLTEALSEVARAQEDVQEAQASEAVALTTLSSLKSNIHDLSQEVKVKSDKISELRDELSKVTEELVTAQQKRSGHWARVEELTAAQTALQANHAAREQELLAQISGLEAEHAARTMDISSLSEARAQQLDAMRQNEKDLRTSLEQAQAEGSGHWEKVTALTEAVSQLRQNLETREQKIAGLETDHAAREQELLAQIAGLEDDHAARVVDISSLSEAHEQQLGAMQQNEKHLRTTLAEAQAKRSGHWKKIEALTETVAQLRQNLEAREQEIAGLETDHAAREQELLAQIAGLETDHAARVIDISSLSEAHEQKLDAMRQTERYLRTTLEEAQAKRSGHWKKVEALTETVAQLRQNLEAREQKIAELEQHRAELLSSTSWRVTKPLRSAQRTLKREKK